MKKRLLAVLLVGMLLISGCSNGGTAKANEKENAPAGNTTTENASNDTKDTSEKKLKVGIIQLAEHIALDRAREGFVEQLEADGFTLDVSYKNAQGDISIVPSIVQTFEADGVDIIYAIATPAAQGAKNIAKETPIIFNAVTDPVAAELVASNEAPGANVTGVSDFISTKTQLEAFKEAFPEMKTIGTLFSTDESNSHVNVELLKESCEELGLELKPIGLNNLNDVPQALSTLTKDIDGYFQTTDNLAAKSTAVIAKKLMEEKIPSFVSEQGPVEEGLLMTNGIDYKELGKSAGKMAEEIFEGKNPGEIPVVFATETKKAVNKTTAAALGIDEGAELFKDAEIVEGVASANK